MEIITFAIAVVGAVLGVISTWHSLDRSRLKLKVVPGHAIPVGSAPSDINFSIEITNLSDFAVTIREAGLLFRGGDKRGALINPIIADGGPWPRRLESRSSVNLYGKIDEGTIKKDIRCAYATTECGFTKKGHSPALKQLIRG